MGSPDGYTAVTATDRNPVVMLVVRLLAASSVAGDRIALTNGASPQDDVGALLGPIRLQLARRARKWDKKNRSSSGLCPALTFPRSEPEAGPLLLKRKLQLEENNAYVINYISVIQLSYLLCTVRGRLGPSHEVSLVFSFA